MLRVSLIVAILGVAAETVWYTKDWVKPTTIIGTKVGIEDFILGFGAGGIAAVAYKELFHKTMYKNVSLHISHWVLALPLLAAGFIAHALFAVFGWFSYWANLIGIGSGLILMSFLRRDLEKEALEGGLFLTFITLPVYWLTFLLFPIAKTDYWINENISGVRFLDIPYEDLVWWFFAGALIAILYDYWNLLSLRNQPSK